MTSVQERISALGLTKTSKTGGRRTKNNKKNKPSFEHRLSSMIQQGKPIPKHLAKKAEEIVKNLQMNSDPKVETKIEQELPTFEHQPHDESMPDLLDLPSTIEEFDDSMLDLPSTIEEINDDVVVL